MERAETVYLFDEDPTLLPRVPEHHRTAARRALTATAYLAPRGRWHPNTVVDPDQPPFGLLVLSGILVRDVVLADTTCGELVGPGELLRPWEHFGTDAPMPFEVQWKILEPARIAFLDPEFAKILAVWPGLINNFIQRAIERSHSLALHVAIHCTKRVDLSLLILFWHLADRFGRVGPDGVIVPIRLTHQDLAKLVGATRQSVTTALGELNDSGSVIRQDGGSWLLNGTVPEELQRMHRRRKRRITS